MESENKFQKKYELDSPQKYPKITKQVLNLDDHIDSEPSIKKLGSYAIILNNLKKNSINKKLLLEIKSNLSLQEFKEYRNKYLKKIVESNSFYFPKELGLDEYKKPINSKEDKLNKLYRQIEEMAKKEKLNSNINSRKNSTNMISSRKESILENKRKRADSIYEELMIKKKKSKKLKKKEKEENEDIEENGENGENEEENNLEEENDGEASYKNDDDDYNNDEDSQNVRYSFEGGNDDDY